MGKGSGKGAQGGALSVSEQLKAESLTASNFPDIAAANKSRKNAVDLAASAKDSESMMKSKLVPEEEMAELSKKLFAAAKPYRNSAQLWKSLLYLARESLCPALPAFAALGRPRAAYPAKPRCH